VPHDLQDGAENARGLAGRVDSGHYGKGLGHRSPIIC